jgi:peptidoglycan-associated lipoprotein
MVNLNKIYLLLITLIVFSNPGLSQKKEIETGQTEFNDLQYHNAAKYFQKAILKIKDDTPEKQYATYMLAECYRIMNQIKKAEPYYKELIGSNFSDTYPELYLRYADVLKMNGNITGAREYYQKYLEKDPGDQEAKAGLKSCEWIISAQHKSAQINVMPLDIINSNEDDFSPAFLSGNYDQLIFTSNRTGDKVKLTDQWTGSTFSDLLKSKQGADGWGTPEPVEYLGMINSEIHEGTPSLSGDFNTMYFTRCDRMAETKSYCQIWKVKRSDSKWKTPKLVLADSTANVGQPSISSDELTLYFVSDRQGGLGGKDIWVAKRNNREEDFGIPVNPGKTINTPGDEVFPYLFDDTTLYFSSGGHKGFGGWDIYRSAWRNNEWSLPENLEEPYNSGSDDFGIIIKTVGIEGYFTSNRPGGKGGDDIYQFTYKTLLFSISGQVKDNLTLLPLEGALVILTGDDGALSEFYTDRQGRFKFDSTRVLEGLTYELTFKKDNYFSKKEVVDTRQYKENHDFFIEIGLDPIPEKPIVLPDILYELDKWDLSPQYQDSLMQLVGILKDNGNIVIELRSHTDTRGSDEYNEILSQKRAQTVVDFLISQGIDPRRLVAKGYGEKVFRVLDKDLVRENYRFKAGTELNDKFINGLPTNEIKEAAFQLNRRTEFSVLSKDFKP